jgi:hypothetical protein
MKYYPMTQSLLAALTMALLLSLLVNIVSIVSRIYAHTPSGDPLPSDNEEELAIIIGLCRVQRH